PRRAVDEADQGQQGEARRRKGDRPRGDRPGRRSSRARRTWVEAFARRTPRLSPSAGAARRRALFGARAQRGRGRILDRSADRASRRKGGLNGPEEIAPDIREAQARAGGARTPGAEAGAQNRGPAGE